MGTTRGSAPWRLGELGGLVAFVILAVPPVVLWLLMHAPMYTVEIGPSTQHLNMFESFESTDRVLLVAIGATGLLALVGAYATSRVDVHDALEDASFPAAPPGIGICAVLAAVAVAVGLVAFATLLSYGLGWKDAPVLVRLVDGHNSWGWAAVCLWLLLLFWPYVWITVFAISWLLPIRDRRQAVGTTSTVSRPDGMDAETPSTSLMKTCPDCAEEVRAAARKCRYCGFQFSDGTF